MNKHAVFHLPDSSYCHALSETRICIRLRAAKGDIKRCVLFYGDRMYPEPSVIMHTQEMERVASDRLFDYFEADFHTDINRICYYFWLTDGTEDYYYYSGIFTHTPTHNRVEYFQFPTSTAMTSLSFPNGPSMRCCIKSFPTALQPERDISAARKSPCP